MPTKIKICGITRPEEVEFINESDVDYVGFVFAKSKRRVSTEQAEELSALLREDILKCGIFVDHTPEEINKIAKAVGLDMAQVHKNYTRLMVTEIDIPVWYAVNVKDMGSIKEINEAAKYENVAGIVADSYVKGQSGGTGKAFNWDLLNGIDENVFLILAGGLNEDNIDNAIRKVKPDVADVSSGAEITDESGTHKSKEKVFSLVRKVKGNE